MADKPASSRTAIANIAQLMREGSLSNLKTGADVTRALRSELAAKGLKGFKRGGKVKKTGVAKLHKGERVLTAKQAKAMPKKATSKAPARQRRR
jgi:hypothetical protein